MFSNYWSDSFKACSIYFKLSFRKKYSRLISTSPGKRRGHKQLDLFRIRAPNYFVWSRKNLGQKLIWSRLMMTTMKTLWLANKFCICWSTRQFFMRLATPVMFLLLFIKHVKPQAALGAVLFTLTQCLVIVYARN